MRLPFKLIVIFSVTLIFLGGTSADEELEFSATSENEGDAYTAGETAKRNLAALARNGRLPRFHYHKKLSPGGRTAWVGDQALQADAAEKLGVVEALGRLSEAAIFPYIGPHRFSFLHSMRMRRDVSSQQDNLTNLDKRNVAALARNGWLPAGSSRGPRSKAPSKTFYRKSYSDDVDARVSAEDLEDDLRDCVDDVFEVPVQEKRNLQHMAKNGWLPPYSYRRVWGSNGAGGGSPMDTWQETRPRRSIRRCRTSSSSSSSEATAAKRNLPFMARVGMIPRS
ncbi:uncharacterized protein LOC135370508 [Ornithodoros turicata]|uniref:uncharacterized protein LOC135370508 n=1 Tax=Ornithodoros turicata TaxID=34597 RepID=UPI0031389B43